jgi:hypothetical protein
MRYSLRSGVMVLALAATPPIPAHAQTAATGPKLVSSHRDWSVYEVTDSRGRICYVASEPVRQAGNYSRRDPPAVLVARLPGTTPSEEVSVQPGYAYRKGSTVEVKVDGREYELFTDGDHAWTRKSEEDRALIGSMKGGSTMTVKGTSMRDTYSLDTYSLSGFTAAYEAMRGACPP